MDTHTQGETNVTVSAVIVRACSVCGGKRETDADCAACGNTEPAQTHDLGVQAAYYENPLQRLAWEMFGKRAAARRAEAANRES